MAGIVTLECLGAVPSGYAPFVCGSSRALGAGQPLHAPTLVQVAADRWRLQAALGHSELPPDPDTWLVGLRSLEPDLFKLGAGFQAAPASLAWRHEFTPAPVAPACELFYYSGWPNVIVEVLGPDPQEIMMRAVGPGRSPGETLWQARIPQAGRGFLLQGPASQYDRPLQGGLYQPHGPLVYLADGEIFQAPPPARRTPPRIETLRFPAPELQHTFVIHVVLPRNYDSRPEQSYPLVLLNDGQNQLTNQGVLGGWHSDSTAARLIREGKMQEAVLAAIEMHPDRNRAFLPHGDQHSPHGQAQVYTDLLAGPVIEMLRQRYRIRRGAQYTALIGASNGAAHALFAGLNRPDAFGLVGCLSYTAMTPERNLARLEQLTQLPIQRMYLDSGTRWDEEDGENDSDDQTMATYQLRDQLLARGLILEQSLRYRLAYGDAHNERAWRGRIASCLEFLLPPE